MSMSMDILFFHNTPFATQNKFINKHKWAINAENAEDNRPRKAILLRLIIQEKTVRQGWAACNRSD